MGEDPLVAVKFPKKLDNFPFQPGSSKLSGKKCVWNKGKLSTYYLTCLMQAKTHCELRAAEQRAAEVQSQQRIEEAAIAFYRLQRYPGTGESKWNSRDFSCANGYFL